MGAGGFEVLQSRLIMFDKLCVAFENLRKRLKKKSHSLDVLLSQTIAIEFYHIVLFARSSHVLS